MYHRIITILSLIAFSGAGYVGYRYIEQQTRADRAIAQLDAVTHDYERLRVSYNDLVRRTAVTELIVEDGKLAVAIRTAEGELKRIETPYDPAGEIYVDYLVLDGRLWIRRVFDDKTTPRDATVITPTLSDVDWSAKHVQLGKAVYRSLTEGRWTITVTGDGSLGLDRTPDPAPPLEAPPKIQRFSEVNSK